MKLKKARFLLIFCIWICGCMLFNSIQLAQKQKTYKNSITTEIEKFLRQQSYFLHSLREQILPYMQQEDLNMVIYLLRIYEDHMFILAKQGLSVATNIYLVSLDMPQYILGSNGQANLTMLAPHQNYYLQVVENPDTLIVSKIYTLDAMPKHKLVNVGLGMIDLHGQIDIRMAVDAIERLIVSMVPNEFFAFKFDDELSNPILEISPKAYWNAIIMPTILQGVYLFCVLIGLYIFQVYRQRYGVLCADLHSVKAQNQNLNTSLSAYKDIVAIQYKYGDKNMQKSNISLTMLEILTDAIAINSDLTHTRNISVSITDSDMAMVKIGKPLLCMQLISGILYEIIMQLPNAAKINVDIQIEYLGNSQQRIICEFVDDGFYSTLEYSEEPNIADIRAKGLERITYLLAELKAEIHHQHQAYQGNTITISFMQNVCSNVISLAF